MYLADQRDTVGRKILAAGEWEEGYAERVCAQPGGMRGQTGGDDSGDKNGNHVAEIGALKTKKRATHRIGWIAVFLSMVRYVVRRICEVF